MTLTEARQIIGAQERSLRKLDGKRFTYGGFEYRLKYMGGFASYIGIDRRAIGRRNFKYFGGIGGYKYGSASDAMDEIERIVRNDLS
ncbi:MAG: hypothetical protein IKE23_05565 [Exiguobacterium sp.]|nr:hypothetical protein [Exiguobacterium sp.]